LIPKDDGSGGVKYFEGFPIPSTLSIVIILWICFEFRWPLKGTFALFGHEAHYFTILYFVWALCMVSSNIKIRKF
jgi:phosphatidylserine synthase